MEKKEEKKKKEVKWDSNCPHLQISFQDTKFISKICLHPESCGFCIKKYCPRINNV